MAQLPWCQHWEFWARMLAPAPEPDERQGRLQAMEQRIQGQARQLEAVLATQRAMPYYAWWRQKAKRGKHG